MPICELIILFVYWINSYFGVYLISMVLHQLFIVCLIISGVINIITDINNKNIIYRISNMLICYINVLRWLYPVSSKKLSKFKMF